MSTATPVAQMPVAPASTWQPPVPLRAGPEMAALKPFHSNCVWTGTVQAGGMGPGSPRMTANGKATFTPIMDGAWLVGDFEQAQFVDDKMVITWKAHYVVGWHPQEQVYKVTYVDNNGSATVMQGRLEDKRFIVETIGTPAIQLRLTWTLLKPGQVQWRNECSVNGSPWFLVEEYLCTTV